MKYLMKCLKLSLQVISVILVIFRGAPAQESPHVVMKFECEICHNTEKWEEIHFDHGPTGFLLIDSHAGLQCQQCHSLKDFWAARRDCGSCHLDVHQGRLGIDCRQCHTPVRWSVIDPYRAHANTTFPLLGAHAKLDCNACHYAEIEGEFSRLQADCIFCHEKDFNSAKVPNHVASNFSRQCELCHTLFTWQPATFKEHDAYFPIFSGTHSGKWDTCRDCHFNPSTYIDFSCFKCHGLNSTNGEHKEVSGYVYDSNACYSCHPRA